MKNGKQSAKQLDRERLNAEKAQKSKKSKSNNKSDVKKVKKKSGLLKKDVHMTMPYKKVLANNIWLIADKTYSKAYSFQDINYNLGDENQQVDILQNYSNYLSTLDDTVDCQVCIWNSL
jgi:hypothetical protein